MVHTTHLWNRAIDLMVWNKSPGGCDCEEYGVGPAGGGLRRGFSAHRLLLQQAQEGALGQILEVADGRILDVNDQSEVTRLMQTTKKMVLYMHADWCGGCDPEGFASTFGSPKYNGTALFCVADFDAIHDNQFHTGYAPTIVLIENGQVVLKFPGNNFTTVMSFVD